MFLISYFDYSEKLQKEKGVANHPRKVYCWYEKEEYREMIACDNQSCKIEWFHFDCVGLVEAPVGNWFCHDCSELTGFV